MSEETASTTKGSKAKKNRTLHKDRSYLQSKTPPTSLAGTVRYRLRPVASNLTPSAKMKKDRKVYYAEVVPWGTVSLEGLLQRMDDERLPVSQHTARLVLLTAMDTIVKCLKEGKQVTIDDFFTFGLSLPGRVGHYFGSRPKDEEEVAKREALGKEISLDATVRGKLSVQPWMRCSPAMLDALNKDLQITHMGSTQAVQNDLISIPKSRRPRKPKATKS